MSDKNKPISTNATESTQDSFTPFEQHLANPPVTTVSSESSFPEAEAETKRKSSKNYATE
jgi:hypothetical protein